jgi:DNA polymerase III gamma/tau subunit
MMACHDPLPNGDPCLKCSACQAILDERWDSDVLMIDGGDSGKEDLINSVTSFIATPPFFGSHRKVVIIEEIQELSKAAKNSLLKILEHPCKGIHFILLSMEYGGATGFSSRCVPFNFRKASTKELMFFLKKTMEREGLWNNKEVPDEFRLKGLSTIAQVAQGSIRQALQLLETCVISKYFTSQEIQDNLGLADEATVIGILLKLLNKERTVWADLVKYDPFEFFAVAYKIISDAFMYKVAQFLENEDNEFFANNTKSLAAHSQFEGLTSIFEKIALVSKPYLRKSEMICLLASFYNSLPSKEKGSPMPIRQLHS